MKSLGGRERSYQNWYVALFAVLLTLLPAITYQKITAKHSKINYKITADLVVFIM